MNLRITNHHGEVTERHGARTGPHEHRRVPAVLLAHLLHRARRGGVGVGQNTDRPAGAAPSDLSAEDPPTLTLTLADGAGWRAVCAHERHKPLVGLHAPVRAWAAPGPVSLARATAKSLQAVIS